MGHVNAPMIFGTLSVVEMALAALGIPARARRRAGRGGVSGEERACVVAWLGSPDEAQRNPGPPFPHCASLHAGYG
jgi:hypothetical protein